MRKRAIMEQGCAGAAAVFSRVLLAIALCIGMAPPLALAAAGDSGSGIQAFARSGKSGKPGEADKSEEPGSSDSGSGDGDSESEEGEGSKADGESSSSAGEDEAKGSSSSSSSSGGDDEPDEPAAPTLAGLYLFYENYDKPTKPLAYNPTADPLVAKDKGTMQLYAQSEFTNGNIGWVDETGVGVVWSVEHSYDEDGAELEKPLAEVDRADGLVRALGQGNGGDEPGGSGGSDADDEPGGGGTDSGDNPKPGPGTTGPADDDSSGGDPDSGVGDGNEAPQPSGAEARQEAVQDEQLATGSNVQAVEQTVEVRAEATEATERAIEEMMGDSQHRYQVYEMMSAQPALLEALDLENPLAPFVAPGMALVALAGGAYSWLWFRRQTAGSGTPPPLRAATAALLSAIARW